MASSSSSSSARPAPLSFAAIPKPFAVNNNDGSDSEPPSPPGSHPGTPRSLSFLTPPLPTTALPFVATGSPLAQLAQNPFSPPASVISFSATQETTTPGAVAGSSSGGYPFPSPGNTRTSSLVDVPRAFSTYSVGASGSQSGSRPATGNSSSDLSAHRPSGSLHTQAPATPGKREAFASPPARPLTIYATPPASSARIRPARPKSTALLVPSNNASEVTVADSEKPMKKKWSGSVRPTLKEKLDKPWIGTRDPRAGWAYWVTYATVFLGVAAGAFRIWNEWSSVMLLKGNLCPVMIEDFTDTDTDALFGDNGKFFREVDASGFGNGEFEMTTNSNNNSFILNNQLYIYPSLTSDVIAQSAILNGAVYNLTGCTYNITHATDYTSTTGPESGPDSKNGSTSSTSTSGSPVAPFDVDAYLKACSAVSNSTLGKILPPVMSARISTRQSASIKYGRVEVVAKLPTGDWLWPAIWMLPVDDKYGSWPLSGEIDIMEARGNGPSYPKQGIDWVRSSLNWGPVPFLNGVAKTFGYRQFRRGRYDRGFHTFALEWDEDFMRMYVDSRLKYVYHLRLKKSFWDLGDFPPVVQNGSESVVLANPWVNGTKAAPFDQPFYLIMNVAVGGTNGWFPDGPEKPWLDGSATAPRDFLESQSQWYPSWPSDVAQRSMVIDSVKMWEQC